MHVIDHPPIPAIAVMNAAANSISGLNQKTYARLKTSLQLNLRRQIFVAVCDDLELRSQVVGQLQTELAPQFVSLNLNLADPNPLAQVAQWLGQRELRSPCVGFQILGIEHLTRQPAPVQKRFLTHLQAIEYYMPALECTMLLWVPRPWLRSIRQSAPTFWEWHTALFEFEGDPTPLRPVLGTRSTHHLPAAPPPQAPPHPAVVRVPLAQIDPWVGAIPPDRDGNELEETALLQPPDSLPETLWEILTQDLAELDTPRSLAAPVEPAISAANPAARLGAGVAAPVPSVAPVVTPSTKPASPLKRCLLAALEQNPESEQHQAGWESFQRIEQLELQVPPQTLAAAYYSLGRAYRECIEQGDSSELTLEIAIAAHEQTLELLTPEPTTGADVANDLGNLYWMRSRNAIEADQQLLSLEQAIRAYQVALTKTDDNADPNTCAMIQNNLGSAYGDLAQYREPAENLQKSVVAYEAALAYRSAAADPARYAATQNNLGTACWNLAQQQQPMVWLKRAIAAYQAALQYYTPETEPLSYAMIQNNVGTAYWNLAQHIQPAKTVSATTSASPEILLRSAIAAYQNALVYRTLETAAAACAATQNNLGTAHWDLAMLPGTASSDRRERFYLAITAYEAAIAAVDVLTQQSSHRPALTFDVLATHNNLGLAYFHWAMDHPTGLSAGDRHQALEAALQHHLEALQGWENRVELQQPTLDFVVQTVRALFSEFGIAGQNLALSQIPPAFLPQVMGKL